LLVLPVDLTRVQASGCLQMLVQGLSAEPGSTVVVDAAALLRFDSAALAVLLEFRRVSLALGKNVLIRALPERLRDLASLYGIAELLPAS
jgi:phospholipid transport system transporter-binding protein